MNQRCKDDRVPGTGDWENYMWPHNLDISGAQPGEKSSKVDDAVQPKRSDKSALGPHADLFTDIGPI